MNEKRSVCELLVLFREGRLRPSDYLQECFRRIDARQESVAAWVLIDFPGAMAAALEADHRYRIGSARPLEGIPVGIKDIIDVAGWPTRAGSKLTLETPVAQDAWLVSQLRKLGAIFPGKTVTTEFACFDPPVTRNPWNLEHTPGGSSSGSAAAVADGMIPLAIGTQTGGSITRPASYCGVFAWKPTHRLEWLNGIVPVSSWLDHVGPFANSLEDLELFCRLLGGTPPTVIENTNEFEILIFDDLWKAATPLVQDACWKSVRRIFSNWMAQREGRLGNSTSRHRFSTGLSSSWRDHAHLLPFSWDEMLRHHRTLMCRDLALLHGDKFQHKPSDFGPKVGSLIEHGLKLTDAEYSAAIEFRESCRKSLGQHFMKGTISLQPSTIDVAPGVESTGDPRMNSIWSFVGFPTLTTPVAELFSSGEVRETSSPYRRELPGDERRLPIGLQWIAGAEQDFILFSLAKEAYRYGG